MVETFKIKPVGPALDRFKCDDDRATHHNKGKKPQAYIQSGLRKKKFEDNPSQWKSSAITPSSHTGKFRCTICDTTKGSFYRDPDKTKTGHLCGNCMYEVQDIKAQWSMEDDLRLAEEWLKKNEVTKCPT